MLQVKALLHAADISNHVRPFQIALAHAERVQQEFRRQVACERALGLPVSPHMDAPEQTWCKMEVQFIDYVAGPLWERLGQVSSNQPGPACEIFVAVACTKLAQSAKRLLVRVALPPLVAIICCAVHSWLKEPLCLLCISCGVQMFPTLQEPLQNMRTNRAKFAAMAQSSMDVAGSAIPPDLRTMTPAASSTRSSSSDSADTEAVATGANL
jgi:hypothetical protein